jgi:hypothetical protein
MNTGKDLGMLEDIISWYACSKGKQDKIVQAFPDGPRYFTIYLENLNTVRTPGIVKQVIRNALTSIVRAAGRSLRLTQSLPPPADAEFLFDAGGALGTRVPGGRCNPPILAEHSGAILVGAIRDLRICGSNQQTRLQHVFPRDDDLNLGRAIGNSVVHELGHSIANLADLPGLSNTQNFMHTGNPIPENERNLQNSQRLWAERKHFSSSQTSAFVYRIRVL